MKILSKFFIFCIVGLISFLIDIAFVNVFFFLGLPFYISRTFSITIALLFNFYINRNFTFNSTKKSINKQIFPYVTVYAISNLINLLLSILIVYIFKENVVNINIASLIGTAVSLPFNFVGSNLWTFRK